ncbi:ubiquitin carboxyl-terminal hydrolase isozyme L3 isoform X2 [Erythrolamprus reginae]|uniref:ubiquitin carboxyl-terminal hydrolase isozyme L3 isoform X2 n=1 Tax=Erythrolamprus reginae TaxID=121349 RepID=UPI00396C3299
MGGDGARRWTPPISPASTDEPTRPGGGGGRGDAALSASSLTPLPALVRPGRGHTEGKEPVCHGGSSLAAAGGEPGGGWVTNQFLRQLGIYPSWQFVDVYGSDPELLGLVPRPVCALMLLFPVTQKYETFRMKEEETIKAQGQEVKPGVYFMKQTISNACGTIGLIHAIANNRDKIDFEKDSSLKKFLDESVPMNPEQRAKYLETYDAIRVTHESSAHEGQTEAPSIDEKVDLHFIALVNVDGILYELDGRKPFPISHGRSNVDTFLEDAVGVCKKFMERDPDELRFNAIALAAA